MLRTDVHFCHKPTEANLAVRDWTEANKEHDVFTVSLKDGDVTEAHYSQFFSASKQNQFSIGAK